MIEAKGLTMQYGPVVALQDASFRVSPGEVVGLLGPNGAGKSTTMKILTTYLYPSAGDVVVAGHNVLEEPLEVRRKIGYLPEVVPLYMDMEIRDYLHFVGRARGLRGAKLKERTGWVVDYCGLKPMFRKPIRQLSKGYKQRTGIAQALIHDPEVIILDEPTSGLDPHQILEIRSLIRMLAESSKTVLLSTHILQEVQAVSDRLVVISHGKIVGDGTIEELRRKAGNRDRLVVSLKADRSTVEAKLKDASGSGSLEFDSETDGIVRFVIEAVDADRIQIAIGELAHSEGWTLTELSHEPMKLEDVFLRLTQSKPKQTEPSEQQESSAA